MPSSFRHGSGHHVGVADRRDHHRRGRHRGLRARRSTWATRRWFYPPAQPAASSTSTGVRRPALLIAAGAIANRSVRVAGCSPLGRARPLWSRCGRATVPALPRSRRRAAHPAGLRGLTALAGPVPDREPAVAHRSRTADRWPGDRDPDSESRRHRLAADSPVGDQLPHPQRLLRRRSSCRVHSGLGEPRRWTISTTGSRATPELRFLDYLEGVGGDTAVIWSHDTWVYALADLQIVMPNSAHLQRRGAARTWRSRGDVCRRQTPGADRCRRGVPAALPRNSASSSRAVST